MVLGSCQTDESINREKYHQNLLSYAIPFEKQLQQHKNDPKHTINAVKAYLDSKTHKHCQL